ncbi:MAG TPA: amidase, partial [Acidimicrobiales bacterium]|nr:amidase [Acidimicrobiales bacterium]
ATAIALAAMVHKARAHGVPIVGPAARKFALGFTPAIAAGGLLTLATGGDGGGSIRIPAGFNGLPGMKGTAGRIPRGPRTEIAPLTVVLGCLSRSVRDIARYYDVTAGFDHRDPYSLAKEQGWEARLGTHDLRGKKAVLAPDLGIAVVRPEVEAMVRAAGEQLAADAGLVLVDVPVELPGLGLEWAMSNLVQLMSLLEDHYPDCKDDLTMEIAFGLEIATQVYDLKLAAKAEQARTAANEAMAAVFDQVDFIICATNPDVAFPAEVTMNLQVGDQQVGVENNGVLTIPANIVGNPAVSVPVGTVDGLPVGMQVIGRHLQDALLLDLALTVERERPWAAPAPGTPR